MVTVRGWGPRLWVGTAMGGHAWGVWAFRQHWSWRSLLRKKVSSEASGREARVGGQTGTDVGQMGTDVGKTFQIDQGQAGKPCKHS